VCDLGAQRWPFARDSVKEAVASHVLEHLTTDQLFHFMRELYRVCKDGAQITVTLPHPRHDIFLNDPTHQRPVTVGTMIMFSKDHIELMAAKGLMLTPFYKYLGVDFYVHPKVSYKFDPSIENPAEDPEIEWKIKHLNNIVLEFTVGLTAKKGS
jgi:ubiquinone/menaquinone biosynthesis C-methylase UbiE